VLPVLPRRIMVKFGLALGMAFGIRVGALLVGPYMVAGIFLSLLGEWRAGLDWRGLRRHVGLIVVKLLPALVIAYAVMAVSWPWGVMNPLNPVKALLAFSAYPINIDTLVAGEWVKASHLPRDYLPDYLLVNLPEIVLVGLVLSGVAGVVWLGRRLHSGPRLLVGLERSNRRVLSGRLLRLRATDRL
jgi:hypothetical protein